MPLATNPAPESSGPLADYFWIAGVDGKEIEDTYWKLRNDYLSNRDSTPGPAFSDTIEEDAELEEDGHSKPSEAVGAADTKNAKRNSYNRLSRLSNDARMSIRSVDSKVSGTNSNRSSMTIRAVAPSTEISESNTGSGDFDFDKALIKFAFERENFLNDLSLSAGAITQNKPKPRPKMQKIVSDDKPVSTNPLRSGIGSVRRHMSFRDMNSMKRQPSVARQGE